MFEFIFAKKPIPCTGKIRNSEFKLQQLDKVRPLKWEEHCVECAPPTCYQQCMHYQRRADGACIRLTNGLQRDKNYCGRYSYGIRCNFRVWSKLEALVIPITVAPHLDHILTGIEHAVIGGLLLFSKIMHDYRYLAWGSCYWSKYLLAFNWIGHKKSPDYFWIEGDLLEEKEVNVRLQIFSNEHILYSNSLTFRPGHNIFSIPYGSLRIADEKEVRIFLAPDVPEQKEICIVFQWLDFVRLKKREQLFAEKVKCVVWDLDQTLYDGIISETGLSGLKRRPRMETILKNLDRRGILNTICSKNDFASVKELLTGWGLWEYFVCPAINWGQKSENIRQIAQQLNLGLDAFAFIDDNPHERMEVQSHLPAVRVYSENSAELLLDFPEFAGADNGMGQQRRLSYQAEEKRIAFKENFSEQYDVYLQNLQMQLTVLPLIAEDIKKRCFELLARSNQLNLTTRRYTEEEFSQLIKNPNIFSWAFSCEDIFGDYGVIGFAAICKNGVDTPPVLTDLVISCRVARKKVEEAILVSIGKKLLNAGFSTIRANLIKTPKNGPIASVFADLPFNKTAENDIECCYEIDLQKLVNFPLIVTIKEQN